MAKKGKGPQYLVDPLTGCWVWQRYVNKQTGYGMLGRPDGGKSLTTAHRYFFELADGPVPPEMELDHACHTKALAAGRCPGGAACVHRLCCNPAHMEMVTHAENVGRGASASLTPDLVRQIRLLKGRASGPSVANDYGVSSSTIYGIWAGRTWKAA